MLPIRINYLRWRISQPGYYKQRAIQMAEQYGDWLVESEIAFNKDIIKDKQIREEWVAFSRKADIYRKRMVWYINKIC